MAQAFDFGAVGDGKTDDTLAVQHALDAGDGVLRLHKGVFRLTRPLVIDLGKTGYTAVLGDGGATRLLMTGPGPAIRIVGSHQGTALPSSVQPPVWEKERFPTVRGVEILGDHPEAVGIELRRTMQATLTEILVRRCKYAIRLTERNRNLTIANCHLYDNGEYGVFFDRCNLHQTNILGCHISYNRRAGIVQIGGEIHNLQITGNDIEYNNRPGEDTPAAGGSEIFFDAREGRVSEVTIGGNTIQGTVEPGGANLRIWGPPESPTHGACLIALTGNVLGAQTRGIELSNVFRMTISGNAIYDAGELSVHARQCRGIAMGSNTICWRPQSDQPRDGLRFDDCELVSIHGLVAERLCSGSQEAGAALMFHRCRDVQVANCQLADPLHAGLELVDCQRVQIHGNRIVDRKKPATMRHALRLGGVNRHVDIRGNQWGGATAGSISGGADGCVLHENLEVD